MMMLTIRNLKKNDVIPLLLALPKQTVFSLEELEDAPTPKEKAKGKTYGKPDDVLSLTGKSASKGSNREAILTTFEKLEVQHGIGSVTRKMFRDECKNKKQDAQIIYQLIREGYLKQLGA